MQRRAAVRLAVGVVLCAALWLYAPLAFPRRIALNAVIDVTTSLGQQLFGDLRIAALAISDHVRPGDYVTVVKVSSPPPTATGSPGRQCIAGLWHQSDSATRPELEQLRAEIEALSLEPEGTGWGSPLAEALKKLSQRGWSPKGMRPECVFLVQLSDDQPDFSPPYLKQYVPPTDSHVFILGCRATTGTAQQLSTFGLHPTVKGPSEVAAGAQALIVRMDEARRRPALVVAIRLLGLALLLLCAGAAVACLLSARAGLGGFVRVRRPPLGANLADGSGPWWGWWWPGRSAVIGPENSVLGLPVPQGHGAVIWTKPNREVWIRPLGDSVVTVAGEVAGPPGRVLYNPNVLGTHPLVHLYIDDVDVEYMYGQPN